MIGIGIAAALAGAFWYADQAGEVANEGIEITANVKGNPEAEVVLVEYSDFQCPACAAAAPVVNQLIEDYGDSVRFEYRHFPLTSIHPLAIPAARAAEAAGQQGKFFEMHDLLFENQQTWSRAANPTALFMGYAGELGLDTGQFKTQMNASKIDDHVRAQFDEARSLGLTGTPTFTLNGERMVFDSYQSFVDQVVAAIGGEVAADAETEAALDVEFEI